MKSNRTEQKSIYHHRTECDVEAEAPASVQLDEIIEDFLLRTRRLLVVGEVNEMMSTYVCSYIQLFSMKKGPIYMYINSPGGCLSDGYAIIDQMLACSCPITTIVRGQGHSMGAMIAAFGTKGCRYATPNSSLMLHSMLIQNLGSSVEQHAEMTEYIQHDYRRKMVELAKRMKMTACKLTELMAKTRWMIPQQAIDIGLIDGIWTPRMEKSLDRGCER